jgi:hypothetical protein
LESILTTGVFRRPEGASVPAGGFPDAWFAHPDDIAPLMAEGGFSRLARMACDALAYELEEKINAAPEPLHRQWIDLLYRLSGEPSLIGAGGHILYVGAIPAKDDGFAGGTLEESS